jgi:hypothetical protein
MQKHMSLQELNQNFKCIKSLHDECVPLFHPKFVVFLCVQSVCIKLQSNSFHLFGMYVKCDFSYEGKNID